MSYKKSMVGRPFHNHWIELNYEPQKVNGRSVALCLQCNRLLRNTSIFRLQSHRNVCKIINDCETQNEFCSFPRNDSSSDEIEELSEPEEKKPRFLTPIKRKYPTEKIRQPVFVEPIILNDPLMPNSNTSTNTNDNIDLSIAEFFFGCNLPFSVVESDHFRNFVLTLNPSFDQIPTKETLSTILLNKVYQKSLQFQSTSKDAVLLIDSWKQNSNGNRQVISMLNFGKGKIHFLNSWEFSGTKENDYLPLVINESINLSKIRYDADIYALISDNSTSNTKLEKQNKMWHLRSVSYIAKLLAKDMVPSVLSSKINLIIDNFKLLDPNANISIMTSSDPKWNTYSDTIESVLNQIESLKVIAKTENGNYLKREVKKIIFDDEFFLELEYYHEIFELINKFVNICQNADLTIAEFVHEFITLEKELELTRTTEFQQILEKLKCVATNKYSLAAYHLHPLYKGRELKDEEFDTVEYFLIDELNSNGLDELQNYKNNNGIFRKLNEIENISAETYWNLAARSNPNLSRLVLKLLRLPANASTQIDRKFSNWSFVHSIDRNKLPIDDVNKLINVYYYLKSKDTNSSTDY